MVNKEAIQLKLASNTQVEAMAQMLVAQGRKLRDLEIKLQKEKQEKANLEIDFQHLLDQLSLLATVSNINKEHIVACG